MSDPRAKAGTPPVAGPGSLPRALWQLEGVTLPGRDRPRLRSASCTIERGVTLVLGPSGAGKTSLLDLLVDYARPARGSVTFLGTSRAWMPSDFGLWPHVTVRDHLCLVHPGPSEEAARACAALLARLGLDAVTARRPRELSTGQQSRLALARALATGADALVLDEPFAHLDDDGARRCRAALADAVAAGRSLVVATHAPHWLDGLATACLDVADGVVTPRARPSQARVATGFLAVALALLGACAPAPEVARLEPARALVALPADDARAPAPRAVAPGHGASWLVLDDTGRVLVFEGGAARRQWSMPETAAGNPEGVCALADGRIAVADTHYHRVVFFAADGAVLGTLGELGDGPGQFRYPVSIAQDRHGALYVAEYGGNDRVQKFTADGAFVRAFGRFGTGPGELQRCAGLAIHGDVLFVADAMNGRVLAFTLDGEPRGIAAEGLDCPYDVACTDDGDLVVVEHGAGSMTLLGAGGVARARYGKPGRGQHDLATPWSVAVRGRTAWVADTGNRRLVELAF